MKLKVIFLLLPLVLVPGLWPAGAQDNGSDDGSNGPDLGVLAEQIEIMRRVLVRALLEKSVDYATNRYGSAVDFVARGKKLGAAYEDLSTTFNTARGLYSNALVHARGYYLPGQGVVYTVDLYIPVKQVSEPPAEVKDAWEEARKEVERGKNAKVVNYLMQSRGRTRKILDPDAIEKGEDVLLGTLGKHASKMSKLPDGETITLAIYLKPGTSPFISTKARDWKQHVIIQAPKRELTAYGDRRCSLHDLKKRVRVTRY
jgi:hypothetical protein